MKDFENAKTPDFVMTRSDLEPDDLPIGAIWVSRSDRPPGDQAWVKTKDGWVSRKAPPRKPA